MNLWLLVNQEKCDRHLHMEDQQPGPRHQNHYPGSEEDNLETKQENLPNANDCHQAAMGFKACRPWTWLGEMWELGDQTVLIIMFGWRGYWLLGIIILVSSWDTANHNLTTATTRAPDQDNKTVPTLLPSSSSLYSSINGGLQCTWLTALHYYHGSPEPWVRGLMLFVDNYISLQVPV